jgi:uncharacterized membrane protein YtjA (UPF0391 family)
MVRKSGSCTVGAVEIKTINNKTNMLHYTVVFLIVALIAAVLGFGVVAGTAALIAKFCFVLFLVLFVVSLLTGRKTQA